MTSEVVEVEDVLDGVSECDLLLGEEQTDLVAELVDSDGLEVVQTDIAGV